MKGVFITGGTGYLGQRLVPKLMERGCRVRALARESSLKKLPTGCEAIIGDALNNKTYRDKIRPADTFVHLVGVSHPNPSKADLFRKVDLASVQQAVEAARAAQVKHFVYVSVAQPAPIMKAYVQVRAEWTDYSRQWNSGNHPPPMVNFGAGTLVAIFDHSTL